MRMFENRGYCQRTNDTNVSFQARCIEQEKGHHRSEVHSNIMASKKR